MGSSGNEECLMRGSAGSRVLSGSLGSHVVAAKSSLPVSSSDQIKIKLQRLSSRTICLGHIHPVHHSLFWKLAGSTDLKHITQQGTGYTGGVQSACISYIKKNTSYVLPLKSTSFPSSPFSSSQSLHRCCYRPSSPPQILLPPAPSSLLPILAFPSCPCRWISPVWQVIEIHHRHRHRTCASVRGRLSRQRQHWRRQTEPVEAPR